MNLRDYIAAMVDDDFDENYKFVKGPLGEIGLELDKIDKSDYVMVV